MMTKIKQLLARFLETDMIFRDMYNWRVNQCRAQETAIKKLLTTNAMLISAATELCVETGAVDELDNPIQDEAHFAAYSVRRQQTLTGKD